MGDNFVVDWQKIIVEFLKEKRKELNLTLREIEEKTGVSNAYISQIERYKRKPSLDILIKLSTLYEFDIKFEMTKKIKTSLL